VNGESLLDRLTEALNLGAKGQEYPTGASVTLKLPERLVNALAATGTFLGIVIALLLLQGV